MPPHDFLIAVQYFDINMLDALTNDPMTNVSQKNQRQNIHSRDLNELSVEVCHVQGKFLLGAFT